MELRETHRYRRKSSVAEVGDIVLIHDDSKPRGFWKLARVTDMITGRDGQKRGAILKVASSGDHETTPLQRLYPLETTQGEKTTDSTEHSCNVEEEANPGIQSASAIFYKVQL